MAEKWIFDASIDAEDKQYLQIREIVSLAMEYKHKAEFEAARILLNRASSSPVAMLELAKLYRDTPQLAMDRRTRYKSAEVILLKLEGEYDIPEICLELWELYRLARKPLSAMGYMMRSKRLGASIPAKSIDAVWHYIEKMDVNTATAADPHGAFVLGCEASLIEDKYNIAIWLLQEAVDNGSGGYVGIAALRLSELFDMHGDCELAKEYADKSAKCGYPPVLINKSVQERIYDYHTSVCLA